jgi:glycerate 2-kinase
MMPADDLKEAAVRIFLSGLAAIDVEALFEAKVELVGSNVLQLGPDLRVPLRDYKEIIVIGIGKASLKMGRAIERLLGERVTRGLLVSNQQPEVGVHSEVIIGGHPTPDEGSLLAGRRLMEVVSSAGDLSLIIYLISGGGSSLAEAPILPGIELADVKELNRVLVTCGASIREINIVRKHLSALKGGRLGALGSRGRSVAIYVSDVNTGDIESIASNPVLPERTALSAFYQVVEKYGLASHLPRRYAEAIRSRSIPELPRASGDVTTYVLSDNRVALESMARAASAEGYAPHVLSDLVEGDYRTIADEILDRAQGLTSSTGGLMPLCLISGGEVSCPVHGSGKGGRNQEFVLYSASKLAPRGKPTALLSCGTDGIDGNSPAAGAVADERTIETASSIGLDYREFLRNNDSYSFFSRAGGSVVTGPTGNNVRDVRLVLSYPD